MKKTTRSNRFTRLTICATTSVLVALPLVAAVTDTASAQPGIGRQRNNRNNNYRRGPMLATVTRDLGGDRFEVRADDSRLFTVRSRSGERRRLRVGDRVLLEGFINNRNVFVAESVRRVNGRGDNGGYNNGRYNNGRYNNGRYNNGRYNNIDFNATVTNVASSTRVIVRADDGRSFTVRSRNTLSSSITRGDRVRVTGYSNNGNEVRSANVVLISNSGVGYPNANTFTISGTVSSGNRAGGTFQLLGSDCRTYRVRPNNESTFTRGQRIRVVGTLRNGTIYASSISRY